MSTPINLNRARKEKARQQAKAEADQNAARFGRTKAERVNDATQNAKAAQMLDGLKLDDEA